MLVYFVFNPLMPGGNKISKVFKQTCTIYQVQEWNHIFKVQGILHWIKNEIFQCLEKETDKVCIPDCLQFDKKQG